MELNENDLYKELPTFITDPSNQAKVEALLEGRTKEVIDGESSKQIAAGLWKPSSQGFWGLII